MTHINMTKDFKCEFLPSINFRTEDFFIKTLAYSDNVYAWLLLHSHFQKQEKYNYIYKDEINFSEMSLYMTKTRKTISKRFNQLLEMRVIREIEINNRKAYKMPYFSDFEALDGLTVYRLITLPLKEQKEEIIKTYALLLKKKREFMKNNESIFLYSVTQLIKDLGRSPSNKQIYERIRGILTILQGAGIIKFRVLLREQKQNGQWIGPRMEIYEVNNKASEEWLGIKR